MLSPSIISLNEKCAYIKKKPIYNKNDLINLKVPIFFNFPLNPSSFKSKISNDIQEKILSFYGGYLLLDELDEDAEKILTRGQLWLGHQAKLMKGIPSQCHYNTAQLYEANRKQPNVEFLIVTGYALSEDGIWRQHSWGLHVRPRKNIIIETTSKRLAYFGFVLNETESEEFYVNNL